jgi:hypothetical protein
MQVSPQRALFNRKKRTEKILNSLYKLVGSSALIAMFAALLYVVIQRNSVQSKIDATYLENVREGGGSGGSRWSQIKESQPALLSQPNRADRQPKEDVNAAAIDEPNTATPAPKEALIAPASPDREPVVSGIADIEAKRPLIETVVRKFFEAGSVSEKLAYVRDPHRVRPLMNDYYTSRPMPQPKWQSLGWTLPVDEPGYRLGYVQATFEEGPPSSLIVEESETGGFAVDWESYVRYGELSWHDFLTMKPAQPTLLRVIASRSDNSDLPPAGYGQEMIEIKHPDEEGSVYAPLDKTNPAMASMVTQLQKGNWKDVPLTLRLCYPGTASDGKVVRIAGIEGKGWLILLQPTRS